jgi:hypothetical protein
MRAHASHNGHKGMQKFYSCVSPRALLVVANWKQGGGSGFAPPAPPRRMPRHRLRHTSRRATGSATPRHRLRHAAPPAPPRRTPRHAAAPVLPIIGITASPAPGLAVWIKSTTARSFQIRNGLKWRWIKNASKQGRSLQIGRDPRRIIPEMQRAALIQPALLTFLVTT